MNPDKVYPRSGDRETVYLKNVITRPGIEVGAYTMYNDFVNDRAGLRTTMCSTTTR